MNRHIAHALNHISWLEPCPLGWRTGLHALHNVSFIGFQQQPEIIWQRVTPSPLARPLAGPLELVVEDFPDLVAVDATALLPAAQDLADILGSRVVARGKLPVLTLMHLQDGSHGVVEALKRLPGVRARLIAGTVARIQFPFRTQEKHRHGQVIVKDKKVDVLAVDARKADPDEAIGKIAKLLQTDNLPVKLPARQSRHAAQDDHERLARLLRLP
jgi:hypothetical protein